MKKKILIFVVTYNAEHTISQVLSRIPEELFDNSALVTEILVIDDCSKDKTFHTGRSYAAEHASLPLTILRNPVNLGYGGNQKLGYRYAIDGGYDIVALLHGDGQYAPEELPRLLQPLLAGECDALFGSRMIAPGAALAGGMPSYKFIGNKILTFLENLLVGTTLSEYHSGYRVYSCHALAQIPFERNSNDFDFDTDIIIQLHAAGKLIQERAIPTFYGNEICHVNGLKYGYKILLSCAQFRLQRLGLFYNRKFDHYLENNQYRPKFHFPSSHSLSLAAVKSGDRVLDLGCGPKELVQPYVDKGCRVTAIDRYISDQLKLICEECHETDVDHLNLKNVIKDDRYQKILALDIIEHLTSPEQFLTKIRESFSDGSATLIITTPNVAFFPVRLMLLLGAFNYGKRGILDMTHTRLFTFRSLRTILSQQGFEILSIKGIPAPFPLALGDSWIARLLLQLNQLANIFLPGLFSYQIYCEARPAPTVDNLLSEALAHTKTLVTEKRAEQSQET